MVIRLDDLIGHNLRVIDHGAATQHRRAGHIGGIQGGEPLIDRLLREDGLEQLHARLTVFIPRGLRIEARVIAPFRSIQGGAQPVPFLVGVGPDGQISIGRLENHVVRRVAMLARPFVDDRERRHAFRPQIGEHRVEHRQANVLALARALALKQGRGNGLRRIDGGRLVGDDRACHARPAGGRVRLDIGETRQRLDEWVIDPLGGVGTVFTDTADRHVDELRVAGEDDVGAKAKPLDRTRPEVLHEHIGAIDQAPQDIGSFGRLEVHRQRALATIAGHKHRREGAGTGAAGVVAGERFNLDHVCALVCQHHGRRRAGDDRGEVQHAEAFERAGHGAFGPSGVFAITAA